VHESKPRVTVMLLVPSDSVRILAVKWLGYQETAYATFAITEYVWLYIGADEETQRTYNNSLAKFTGYVTNYHFRSVSQTLRPL